MARLLGIDNIGPISNIPPRAMRLGKALPSGAVIYNQRPGIYPFRILLGKTEYGPFFRLAVRIEEEAKRKATKRVQDCSPVVRAIGLERPFLLKESPGSSHKFEIPVTCPHICGALLQRGPCPLQP